MLRYKYCYLLLIISALFLSPETSFSQVYNKVVALDGSGTSLSIKSALPRTTGGTAESPYIIYIKNGVYNEKIEVTKDYIRFIGESAEGVIITNGDYNGDGTHGTFDSYTLSVDGKGFYAENITIENSAGNVGQAVALKTDNYEQVFKNCIIKGFQDTYYAHSGMQYLSNCFIEGATDFIFGDATAVMDNCTINCVKGGQYVTAPADSKLTSTRTDGSTMIHGLLFKDCAITKNTDVAANSYFLGRPWQPNASTVYMNCTLGDHIKALGWSDWSNDNHLSSYFAEYKSINTSGDLIDTTGRVDWSYQVSDKYATDYYSLEYFLTKNAVFWDPAPELVSLSTPTGLTGNTYSLTWNSVADAKGYVIIRNDSTIGFSLTNSFNDENAYTGITNIYTVKAVNSKGNLSACSDTYTVALSAINNIENNKDQLIISFSDRVLRTSLPVEIMLFNLSGKLVLYDINNQNINLGKLANGIYIVATKDNSGNITNEKILLR